METQFFMAMVPPTVTAQEHQVTVRKGRPVFYDTPEIKNAKDKLVASEIVEKFWSDIPGIYIHIEELEGNRMNFFGGLFLGAMLGYFAASLCAVAGKDDRNDN